MSDFTSRPPTRGPLFGRIVVEEATGRALQAPELVRDLLPIKAGPEQGDRPALRKGVQDERGKKSGVPESLVAIAVVVATRQRPPMGFEFSPAMGKNRVRLVGGQGFADQVGAAQVEEVTDRRPDRIGLAMGDVVEGVGVRVGAAAGARGPWREQAGGERAVEVGRAEPRTQEGSDHVNRRQHLDVAPAIEKEGLGQVPGACQGRPGVMQAEGQGGGAHFAKRAVADNQVETRGVLGEQARIVPPGDVHGPAGDRVGQPVGCEPGFRRQFPDATGCQAFPGEALVEVEALGDVHGRVGIPGLGQERTQITGARAKLEDARPGIAVEPLQEPEHVDGPEQRGPGQGWMAPFRGEGPDLFGDAGHQGPFPLAQPAQGLEMTAGLPFMHDFGEFADLRLGMDARGIADPVEVRRLKCFHGPVGERGDGGAFALVVFGDEQGHGCLVKRWGRCQRCGTRRTPGAAGPGPPGCGDSRRAGGPRALWRPGAAAPDPTTG